MIMATATSSTTMTLWHRKKRFRKKFLTNRGKGILVSYTDNSGRKSTAQITSIERGSMIKLTYAGTDVS